MRVFKITAVGVLLLAATGCANFRDRRWGPCALGGAFLGGALGGVGGGLGVDMAEKSPVSKHDIVAGVGAGTAGGALLGALLGHMLCDPEKEAPPPPVLAQAPPPPPPAPPARGTRIATVGAANFDFNRAEVKAEGRDVLDHAVRVMRDNPDLRVTVEGHTDSVGSAPYNQKLSERRAEAVKRYLVREGVASNRISIVGFGKSRPLASNDTEEGRAQNRRAEVVAD